MGYEPPGGSTLSGPPLGSATGSHSSASTLQTRLLTGQGCSMLFARAKWWSMQFDAKRGRANRCCLPSVEPRTVALS